MTDVSDNQAMDLSSWITRATGAALKIRLLRLEMQSQVEDVE